MMEPCGTPETSGQGSQSTPFTMTRWVQDVLGMLRSTEVAKIKVDILTDKVIILKLGRDILRRTDQNIFLYSPVELP